MTVLNNVVHFRGELVALYGTFKIPTSESAAGFLESFSPAVKVEYANAANQIVTILPLISMKRITPERWVYNWTIPMNAPFTTYNVVTQGTIDDKLVQSTEDLVIGNPALTTKQNFLRYGRDSYLQMSRTYEPRLSPQLPRGTF
jgi:hypothetical protein